MYRPDWHCATCDFMIYGSKEQCKKCGTKRPEEKSSSDSLSTSTLSTSNITNTTNTTNSKKIFKDWHCATCDFMIYGSKDQCKKCGTKRPEENINQTVKINQTDSKKDWYCVTCVFMIYGSKDQCKKCGTRRS